MIRLLLITLVCVSLCGCSSLTRKKSPAEKKIPRGLTELHALQSLSGAKPQSDQSNNIRLNAIRDTALRVGAQGGLAWQAGEINQALLGYEDILFRIFDFNRLLLEDSILPPVLTEGRETLDVASPTSIRISDRNYEIVTQARFVTTAPTWRDYLWMNYQQPEIPHYSLLPRNKAEKGLWEIYVARGFEAGIKQAHTIHMEKLSLLKRDMEGMIRYKTLLVQNKVSPPFVAKLELGVTGSKDKLAVNDRVLRITALPALQTNSNNWKTDILSHE